MKRLILFLVLMVSVAISAQTVTFPAFPIGDTYKYVPTDYTITNNTVRNFIWQAPMHQAATQDFIAKLDSLTGNHTRISVELQGAKSLIQNIYTRIGIVTWYCTTKDTVVSISNTSANRYRFYKTIYTGVGTGTSSIRDQELKVYLE